MPVDWPEISYEAWIATCDTLHAHTQVLGKLAATLAPPEPQLQHAALRLTARGWGTAAPPAAGGRGLCPRRTAPARSSSRSTSAATKRSSSTATAARPGPPSRPTAR